MKRTRACAWAIVVAVAAEAWAAGWAAGFERWVQLEPAEAAVVRAALEQCTPTGAQTNRVLVLEDTLSILELCPDTAYEGIAARLREAKVEHEEPLQQAVEDLVAKNEEEARFTLPQEWKGRVALLSRETRRALFSAKGAGGARGWDLFRQKLPNSDGIATVSRPGLSPDGSLAAVYIGYRGPQTAGAGRVWVLRRVDGEWRRQRQSVGPAWGL